MSSSSTASRRLSAVSGAPECGGGAETRVAPGAPRKARTRAVTVPGEGLVCKPIDDEGEGAADNGGAASTATREELDVLARAESIEAQRRWLYGFLEQELELNEEGYRTPPDLNV